jgi:hypothetical protein
MQYLERIQLLIETCSCHGIPLNGIITTPHHHTRGSSKPPVTEQTLPRKTVTDVLFLVGLYHAPSYVTSSATTVFYGWMRRYTGKGIIDCIWMMGRSDTPTADGVTI